MYGKMVSVQEIEQLKENPNKLLDFVKNNNNGPLIFVLNRLGRLPADINKEPFLYLLKNEHENVRSLAVKNLAKMEDISLLTLYQDIIKSDNSSSVRREAVSAIGRLRNKDSIPFLLSLLNDSDPEVVLQSIRGLLVFKNTDSINSKLKSLSNHPNEIVREVIGREFKENHVETEKKFKHCESPIFMKNVVVKADVRDVLKEVPAESIHLTFTSPPYYNARDYSTYQSYQEYLNFLEEVFKEVHRVTKEGRFFILNTSPIIIPRMSRQHSSKRYPIPYDIHPLLIKMGWEFIDDIVWVKSEASVKNRNAGFLQHRKPLAYKPNACSESVMVYRKKTDKLIDWNIREYDWKTVEKSKVKGDYETSNIWKIDPVFDKTHSAVFPLELCNRIVKFYSFIGDLVFDPFAGSGTFGKAALNLNRYFFLTEKEERYVKRIKENIGENGRLSNDFIKPRFFDLNAFKKVAKE